MGQVKDVEVALSHNLGLGGAAVVTVYERPKEWRSLPMKRAVSLGEGPPEAPASKCEPRLVSLDFHVEGFSAGARSRTPAPDTAQVFHRISGIMGCSRCGRRGWCQPSHPKK